MATHTPITPAPISARVFFDRVTAFENIQGDHKSLAGLLDAAANAVGVRPNAEVGHLLNCAVIVADSIARQFVEAVDAAYAIKNEGR